MIRDPRVKRGLLVLAASLPVLVVVGGAGGQVARRGDFSFNISLLAPSLYLGFAVLTLAAPLSNGGGSELFPSEQLVAFPIEPKTTYLGSLASAPLNLAWATQVVSLVTAISFISARSPLVLLSVLTSLSYIAFATTAGQAIGWYVVGCRQSRRGRWVTRSLGALVFVGIGVVLALGDGLALLDNAPTTQVTIAAQAVSGGRFGRWSLVTAGLLAAAVASLWLGQRATAWALRRPSDGAQTEARRQSRRPLAAGHVRQLARADRASVWRSTPLRRGLVVLALLPGAVAAGAQISWSSLALLPGLVAAGSGLLFGVNAFCLDGSGGLWLATLPHSARSSIIAKALITGETCLVAVVAAVLVGSLRSPGAPTAAEITALVSSIVATTGLVVGTCLRLSVERPHKADLRGPRDAPAPPATMAVYSLRLALSTTLVGSLFVGAGASGVVVAGPIIGGLVLVWVLRSLRRTLRAFNVPAARSRVVLVVASG